MPALLHAWAGCFLLVSLQADAAEEFIVPKSSRTDTVVVFGGSKDGQPLHFLGQNGKATGFDVELFHLLAKKAGWEVRYRLSTLQESMTLLEKANGEIDVVPMLVTPKRAEKFLFSKPILHRYAVVFGRKGSKYISSLQDLAGSRVALQYGGAAWERLHTISPSIKLQPELGLSEAMLAVVRGEADYALVPSFTGYVFVKQHPASQLVALSPPLMEGEHAFAISRSRPELLPQIDAALREVQVSGEQDQLYLKWLGNIESPAESYRSGLVIGAKVAVPLLLITLLVYLGWRQARRVAAHHGERATNEEKLRREAQAQVHWLAYSDPLTGLPNRNSLPGLLEACIRSCISASCRCSLVRLDLLRVPATRAIAGKPLEEEMICRVAQRLVQQFGERSVAHLVQGQFAIVIQEAEAPQRFDDRVAGLLSLVEDQVQIGDLTLEPHCCIGVAHFPEHGRTVQELAHAAELACAAAHHNNRRAVIYDLSLEPDPRNLTLLADLRHAIRDGTLGYALQPKLDLATHRILGAEMLVRWDHPKYGSLLPSVFVPLAEQAGMIGEMTLYLVRKALELCGEWKEQGINIELSVNVSVNDLADDRLVEAILAEPDESIHCLMLEVTETDVMRDTERVMDAIARLRQRGIRISLDDFGVGHAPLTYLQRMSPDELKIDRSFVSDLLNSPGNQTIVRTSIELAHKFGAKATAEGIEDLETLEWLQGAGCDAAQGFAISHPMPAGELMRKGLLH